MANRILAVNPGSSSLKLGIVIDGAVAADLRVEGSADSSAVIEFVQRHGPIDAAGIRVVHGGDRYTHSVLVDDDVVSQLDALSALAPLHNPVAIQLLIAVRAHLPAIPLIACFDTAFHSQMPREATTYAVPDQWRSRWGIRRYGFHGLNHSYVSRRAAQVMDREGDEALRLVTCHLGSGASLAAVRGGKSVDTTMGFTPNDGLVMATRSGAFDPGALLWLLRAADLTSTMAEDALEHRSGLVALAGTSDMREVMLRSVAGDARSTLARDVYIHRLTSLIGSMAASLGGIDGLVFTGGVGEGSHEVRELTCSRLAFLGIALDAASNRSYEGGEAIVSDAGSGATVAIVAAHEDLEIAREVTGILETT